MKSEEFDLVEKEIESRINKKIKGTKKLYQANVDGGDPSIFHYKCDNIPNTLTIIKTKGKRRFGGFASTIWESKLLYKEDINSFLFSLDNKKIYSYKKNGLALFCNKINGPSFGNSKNKLGTVSIYGNPIKGGTLYTSESSSTSYEFDGDNNALSEDGKGKGIFIENYEVYQIIF